MSRHSQMSAAHYHRFAFDGTVLERVVLAIIEAHTTEVTQVRQYERLTVAMNALTGDVRPFEQDEATAQALDWMARERHKDNCNAEIAALRAGGISCAPRSLSELALLAAYEFLDCADMVVLQEAAARLRSEFANKQRTDARSRYRIADYDPAREAMETEAVRRLCAELAEWDVPTRL